MLLQQHYIEDSSSPPFSSVVRSTRSYESRSLGVTDSSDIINYILAAFYPALTVDQLDRTQKEEVNYC